MATTVKPKSSKVEVERRRLSEAKPAAKKREAKKDLSETYNEFKQFEG